MPPVPEADVLPSSPRDQNLDFPNFSITVNQRDGRRFRCISNGLIPLAAAKSADPCGVCRCDVPVLENRDPTATTALESSEKASHEKVEPDGDVS